ncbi:jg7620 [Pararge aegeria aegeria]|uniref:Jg7620 protein n=1 Tax=Pararge aegeria aegeria TaxID=348720 RepID=A0A8S4RJ56_9NEOP|nr:jg7620 [Pararge aegeria aegeria]
MRRAASLRARRVAGNKTDLEQENGIVPRDHHHHLNQSTSTAGHRSFGGVPQYTVLGRLPPAAPSYSPDVICPPRWGLTYAAFTWVAIPVL